MISRKAFAWGMYDLANTIYSALFVTFFFPYYVKEHLGGTEAMVGAVFSASMLLVGLFVPAIGAISDYLRRRMPFVALFTALNCILVALVPSFGLKGALILALLANFCYHAALNVYNAMLPSVSDGELIGKISGIGVGMGYMGTFISLGVAYLVMDMIGWGTIQSVKAMFYVTAALFFGLSLVTFFGVPEERRPSPSRGLTESFKHIKRSLWQSMKDISTRKPLRSFLLTMFFFTNAMNSVVVFLFLFSQEAFGLTVRSFFPAYAFFAFGAAAGSFILSKGIDRIGARRTLAAAGWLWLAVIIALLILDLKAGDASGKYRWFLLAGTLGGAALGVVWASSRPLLIDLAPNQKLAEYFGFLELTSKFSGVIGPVVFGYLASYHGYPWAIGSLSIFFIAGLWMMRQVPESAPRTPHAS